MIVIQLYAKLFNCVQKRAKAHLRTLSTKYVYKSYTYLICVHKEDLALDNLQRIIWHEALPSQIIYILYVGIKRIWDEITCKGWYAIKLNLTKSYVYLIYMYKEELSLNNLQWLICHKTKPNQYLKPFNYLQIND